MFSLFQMVKAKEHHRKSQSQEPRETAQRAPEKKVQARERLEFAGEIVIRESKSLKTGSFGWPNFSLIRTICTTLWRENAVLPVAGDDVRGLEPSAFRWHASRLKFFVASANLESIRSKISKTSSNSDAKCAFMCSVFQF